MYPRFDILGQINKHHAAPTDLVGPQLMVANYLQYGAEHVVKDAIV